MLILVIERYNGTTYQQKIEIDGSIANTIKKAKSYLGKGYHIVSWWVEK